MILIRRGACNTGEWCYSDLRRIWNPVSDYGGDYNVLLYVDLEMEKKYFNG